MEIFLTRPWLKAFSSLFVNFAAGWFGAAFITPNFADTSLAAVKVALTKDIVFGIFCLWITVKLEEGLEK